MARPGRPREPFQLLQNAPPAGAESRSVARREASRRPRSSQLLFPGFSAKPMTHPPDPARGGAGTPAPTGLERECLRKAVHDVRNRLNATSILLHIAIEAARKEQTTTATGKVTQAVRELQTIGRLLDQLVASSDTVACEIVPVDLVAAVAEVSRSTMPAARSVVIQAETPHVQTHVLSCPTRLPRVLAMIRERCVAALPEGGTVRFEIGGNATHARVVATASGPKVAALPAGDPFALAETTPPGTEWFEVRALARGLGGEAHLTQEAGGGLRVEIDLPRADRSP